MTPPAAAAPAAPAASSVSALLRPAGSPTRVGDLLLPTILTLAGGNAESARHFLALLSPGPLAHPVEAAPAPRKEVTA
jgi:hypothetical protein